MAKQPSPGTSLYNRDLAGTLTSWSLTKVEGGIWRGPDFRTALLIESFPTLCLSGCLTNPESIVKKALTSQVWKDVLMGSTDVSPTVPFLESHLLGNLWPLLRGFGDKSARRGSLPFKLWREVHSDSFSFGDT